MKTLVIILFILALAVFGFIAYTDHQEATADPYKDCSRIETGTKYVGWQCPGENIYIPPQD